MAGTSSVNIAPAIVVPLIGRVKNCVQSTRFL
jgi:hypothetical protein